MILTCCILVAPPGGGDDKTPVQSSRDRAAYQTAEGKAGRDAEAHVRLALWCEAHGLAAERLKHLSLAVLYDPANTLARGLMGLVAHRGQWDRPGDVERQMQNDPARQAIVKEYLGRRTRTPDRADAQMKLAAWCAEKGLKEQALAHYTVVTQLDPSRDAAWKHLGYKKHGNHWVKPEELAAAKQDAASQKLADKHWKTKLEKLRDGLESKDAARRARAEQSLTAVSDPRAVPMVWALFVRGSERRQIAAVQVLGQIDGPASSNGLAVLAVFSPSIDVRQRAIKKLTQRDPRDVVGRLIGQIHKPYKYQIRHLNGRGSPGELFVEGERFNIQRFYQNQTFAPAVNSGRIYTSDVPFDPYSYRNIAMATMVGLVPNSANDGISTFGKPGYSVTIPFPISTQSAAQAGQAIAADPRNAAAILGQLSASTANQYARTGPLMTPGNAVSSRGNAATAQQIGPDPGGQAAESVMLEMLGAERAAAQQDILIAQGLESIRQANRDLEQRLAMDVRFVEATNDGINRYNDRALPVLKAITGQDIGVEPEKWKSWWTDKLGYAYHSDVPETKPTYSDFIAEANFVDSYVHTACFAADTLVQTIDGPRPIQSIRIGDQVLSQNASTGNLAFQPVVAVHRNHPAATLKIVIDGESIVATGIHRFWKAGKGWTMARDLKAGDRLRMVDGIVAIEAITSDKTQPVYNLDVALDRDFFVGTKGLLVHDFSFVQPVLEPFDRQVDPASVTPLPSGDGTNL